jgi:predicted GIY-YIG superfamily endonuclease
MLTFWFGTKRIHCACYRKREADKGGSRKKKEALINAANPEWKDLYEQL